MQVFPHQSESAQSRTPNRAWIVVLFALAAIVGALSGLVSCASTGAPDWPAIERELDLTAADLEILAETADGLGKATTAQALQAASDAVRQAHAVIASGGPPGDAWALLDASLDALAAVAAKEQDGDLALGVAAARIVLGRVKAHLPAQ